MESKEEVLKALDKAFGSAEEDYDLVRYENNNNFDLIIRYPELTLTNSIGESHTIYDLYVRLTREGRSYTGLEGLRSTFSEDEWGSGYCHSHLHFINTHFTYFCLGSSEISILLQENIFENENTLEYFLAILKKHLSWESLEGVPYIKMSTISGYYPYREELGVPSSMIRDIKLELDKVKVNLNFQVLNKEEIEEKLFKWLISQSYWNNSDRTVIKIGNSYFSESKKELPTKSDIHLLKFKEKDIYLKINKNEKENKSIIRTIHPNVTKAVCNHISKRIKKYYFRDCRYKPEVPANHNPSGMEPGQVSV